MTDVRSATVPSPAAELVVSLLAGDPSPDPSCDRDDVRTLLLRTGLDGLAVALHRDTPFLPRSLARALEPRYLATSLHSTLTLESARRARRLLSGAGIDVLLYKGAALLDAGVHPDPGGRRMDDADLLVHPERADEAVRVLAESGYEPWEPWEPGRLRWLDSVTLTDGHAPSAAEDVTVDLHWRLQYRSLRLGEAGEPESEPDPLWDGADRDRGVPADGPHLVVVAEHLLKHLRVRAHLPGLADLVRLSDRIDDWDAVLARLERRRDAQAFGLLFAVLREDLGAAVPESATRLGGDGWPRRWMRSLLEPVRLVRRVGPADGRARGLLFRWLLGGSLRQAFADVVRTGLPGARWLRARYGSPTVPTPGLLVRYWGDLLRWMAHRGRSPVAPNQGAVE